jgi:site-specific DNA-cytosine methylase
LKLPKTFIIEMVHNKGVLQGFLDRIKEACPQYAVWSGVINSKHATPQQRTRFYIVGIHLGKAV